MRMSLWKTNFSNVNVMEVFEFNGIDFGRLRKGPEVEVFVISTLEMFA